MLADDGAPNRSFFFYMFCDQAMAIQFLKEIGLLRSRVLFFFRDLTLSCRTILIIFT